MISSIQGSPQDWIDILKNYSTIFDCEKWWKDVNKLTWLIDDAKQLRQFYFRHVADIAAKKQREKPIDRYMPKWAVERAEAAKETKGNIKPVLEKCPF